MSDWLQLFLIVVAWGLLIYFTAIVCVRSKVGSVGLPLAYLVTMTFLHIGTLTYLVPGYSHERYDANRYLVKLSYTADMNMQGSIASLLTVVGLFLGCLLMRGGVRKGVAEQASDIVVPANRDALLLPLLAIASLGYIFTSVSIASVQSIIAVLRSLSIVIVALGLWVAFYRRDRIALSRWIMVASAIPAVYLIVFGFFSYGFAAMAILFSFWMAMPRPRAPGSGFKQFFSVFTAIYLSLSLFVSYMEVREQLRWGVLWREGTTQWDKFVGTVNSLSKAHFLNPFDFSQLDWFNVRLNQNILIGRTLWWHEYYPALVLKGQSILYAFLAWVPRFLWADKPEMGGSRFAADHTGLRFSNEVAIATGPTFEFVANFGMIGALFGGFILGIVIRWLDKSCARHLRREDYARFIRNFLIGISVVAPTSQIFYIVSSTAASWIVGTGLMFWMRTGGGQRKKAPRVVGNRPNRVDPVLELSLRPNELLLDRPTID